MSVAKTLWVRESYLNDIRAGRKTVEVRVGYDNIRRLQPGDQLRLNDSYLVTIRRIGHYADFEELLTREDPGEIGVDLSQVELLASLREIYPPDKESLGAVALELSLPRRYDAVLFDMGYTLAYFEPTQELIVQRALHAAGVERSVKEIQSVVQNVWGDYYSDAATATFPATPEYDQETQRKLGSEVLAKLGLQGGPELLRSTLDAINGGFSGPNVLRPYPEVLDVLASLKGEGYRLGIVSNWSWNLRDRVTQVGLDAYFEVVWGSAYAGCNKPHPGIFEQALSRMPAPEVPPDRVLYVGDSYEHDVVGARNAGLDVVLLDRDEVADDPGCPVIGDLRGLSDLLA